MPADQALRKARSLARAGSLREAEALYRTVLKHFPGNKRAQDALAALAQPAARGEPDRRSVEALLAMFHRGRYADVEREGRALLGRFPGSAVLLTIIGGACVKLDLKEDAIDALERAISINPAQLDAHNALGAVLTESGDAERAIVHLGEVTRVKPNHADGHANMGVALAALGRKQEARAALSRAIELKPNHVAAHRQLASLKTFAAGDPQIAAMERLVASAPATSEAAAQLHFALAKAHEDLGDRDAAFSHFAAGNRIRKREAGDSICRTKKRFADIRAVAAGIPRTLNMSRPPDTRRFIFIVGMPRSGTTLVEQILASHSRVHGAGELGFIPRAAMELMTASAKSDFDIARGLETLRDRYEAATAALGAGAAVLVDKLPTNFQWAGFIAAAFPDAAILHTVRDPVATCWSNYRHYFPSRALDFAWDLDDLAAYYCLYREQMAFWHERFPGRIHDVGYEALTENPERETRRLLELSGLPFEQACLESHTSARTVTTASAQQVRQKIYTGSSDAWRAYEAHLGPLLKLKG